LRAFSDLTYAGMESTPPWLLMPRLLLLQLPLPLLLLLLLVTALQCWGATLLVPPNTEDTTSRTVFIEPAAAAAAACSNAYQCWDDTLVTPSHTAQTASVAIDTICCCCCFLQCITVLGRCSAIPSNTADL
jgi:hypothetical protein